MPPTVAEEQTRELAQVLAAERQLADEGLPADPRLAFRRGRLLNMLLRYAEALTACDEAESLWRAQGLTDTGEVAHLRGSVLHHLNRYQEAQGQLEKAMQLRASQGLPEDAKIYLQYGLTISRQGRYLQSDEILEKARAIYEEQGLPLNPGLFVGIGGNRLWTGRPEAALKAYDECRLLCLEQGLPVPPYVANNSANALIKLGRYEEALLLLEESEQQYLDLGLTPWPGIFSNRGMALGKLGRFEEAMAAYAESDRLARESGIPEDARWIFNCAMTLHDAGHQARAVHEAYRAVLHFGRMGIEPPAFVSETLQDWLSPNPQQVIAEQQASQPEAIKPIADSEKKFDAFICYRRDPALGHAMLVKTHMDLNGKSVFRDQDDLHKGHFADDLVEAIRNSRHMVILLTPSFFERCCSDEKDIVRQEIATALQHGTHIIPVMMEGFGWPKPEDLPADIQAITGINAMSYSTEFFNAFIDKLIRWME